MSKQAKGFVRYATYNDMLQDDAEEGIKFRVTDYDDKGKVWHNLFMGYMPEKKNLPEVDGEVKVLDLGCNTGYMTRDLRDRFGHAEGVDTNRRLIAHSKFNIDTCKLGKMEDLPFDDESFSFVVAKDVLEHSPDPDTALEEIYRVLADNGNLLVMIPLDGEPYNRDDVIIHPSHNYNNETHLWKATEVGVFRRLFAIGYTDVQFTTICHSDLFGEKRGYGDRVLMVHARKKKDIIKVPIQYLFDAYWSAFLTFNCTGNCWYCIQHVCKDSFLEARVDYEKNKLSGEEWVNFYNRLQKWHSQKLGIIGGEPTIHPDFFEVVNGVKGFYRTITTNLSTKAILQFDHKIENKDNLRINTSFHPKLMTVDAFAERIHLLRDQGFYIDQIAMVDTHEVDFRKYHTEFLARGITIQPQTFLGIFDGELYPNAESSMMEDHGETGINNRTTFMDGFSCARKTQVLCSSGRFLVAPDGGIYRCHYQLYSGVDKQGDVRTGEFPIEQDYRLCEDYGFCNPCDFPSVSFKHVMANLQHILLDVLEGDVETARLLGETVKVFSEKSEAHQKVFNAVFNVLYSSREPWWELYNSQILKDAVNEFICVGGLANNDNAEFIASFEYILFKKLPLGFNIYRILNDEALIKYIAIIGAVHSELMTRHPLIEEYFGDDSILLASVIAKIVATYGTDTAYKDIYISEKVEEETNE